MNRSGRKYHAGQKTGSAGKGFCMGLISAADVAVSQDRSKESSLMHIRQAIREY